MVKKKKEKCTFLTPSKDQKERWSKEGVTPKQINAKMQELLETGANDPAQVSMSDWYYMMDHAEKCKFCFNRFEKLAKKARKNRRIDGPTTLRKS
ncbi:MAG: hypothetical protein WCW87_00595 [Candidatus Paceibacterota bacterium]